MLNYATYDEWVTVSNRKLLLSSEIDFLLLRSIRGGDSASRRLDFSKELSSLECASIAEKRPTEARPTSRLLRNAFVSCLHMEKFSYSC